MRTDIQTIKFVQSLFGNPEGEGVFLSGNFIDLSLRLRHAIAEKPPNASRLAYYYTCITSDLRNISILIDRLNWMRTQSLSSDKFSERWFYYTSVDIQSFHVEIRSIMDYITHIVRLFAPQPGQITDTGSFHKLLNWIDSNPNRIQENVACLCQQQTWFHELRTVRDRLVHSGGQTVVFGSPQDGILFQVFNARLDNLINKPYLMNNPNVAYFDRYAALYTAKAIAFLEDLSILYKDLVESTISLRGAENRSPGYNILVQWMNGLVELLDENPA